MTAEPTPISSNSGYCDDADVQSKVPNDVPLPTGVEIATYINGAADIIDNALSKKYEVPVVTTDEEDLRLLKIINANLAAALLIEALAATTENENVYAYARHLRKLATFGDIAKDGTTVIPGLQSLMLGEYALAGATAIDTDDVVTDGRLNAVSPEYTTSSGGTTKESPFTKLYENFE